MRKKMSYKIVKFKTGEGVLSEISYDTRKKLFNGIAQYFNEADTEFDIELILRNYPTQVVYCNPIEREYQLYEERRFKKVVRQLQRKLHKLIIKL